MNYAIETNELTKSFHGLYAVNRLNMHVPEGSIYGFIGENGSGKSTTEKLICGLLVPRRGSEILLYGKHYTDARIRSQMGVLIENPGCFPNSTVYQNMMMQAMNLGLAHPEKEVKRVLQLVHMSGAAGRKFRQCSLGMKQRLGVAQALMGHPRLLVLDEPINGLDADGMRIVRETLLQLNREEGTTILISSHILGELSKIATHYGIIQEGRLIREVPAHQMQRDFEEYVLVSTVNDLKALGFLKGRYSNVRPTEEGIRIYDCSDSAKIANELFHAGLPVRQLKTEKVELEEYYLNAMKEVG